MKISTDIRKPKMERKRTTTPKLEKSFTPRETPFGAKKSFKKPGEGFSKATDKNIKKLAAPLKRMPLPLFEKCSYEEFKEAVLNRIERGELNLNLTTEEKEIMEKDVDKLMKVWYDKISIPVRATAGSAGHDFVTPLPVIVGEEPTRIPTGIRVKMMHNVYLQLKSRSSLFGNKSKRVLVDGTIDADYYGNKDTHGIIFVQILSLVPNARLEFASGEKIAQGIFHNYLQTENERTNPVKTVRKGGFGSTGTGRK